MRPSSSFACTYANYADGISIGADETTVSPPSDQMNRTQMSNSTILSLAAAIASFVDASLVSACLFVFLHFRHLVDKETFFSFNIPEESW